jgi:hypothetical protein
VSGGRQRRHGVDCGEQLSLPSEIPAAQDVRAIPNLLASSRA